MQREDSGYTGERMLKRKRGRPQRLMDVMKYNMQWIGVIKADARDGVAVVTPKASSQKKK